MSSNVSSFFFNDTATTEIYTLSLHDALPILSRRSRSWLAIRSSCTTPPRAPPRGRSRSEEHTSELQSRLHLVCRLLLEKKKRTSPGDAGTEHRAVVTIPRRCSSACPSQPELC